MCQTLSSNSSYILQSNANTIFYIALNCKRFTAMHYAHLLMHCIYIYETNTARIFKTRYTYNALFYL
jgi:hypothetical protein